MIYKVIQPSFLLQDYVKDYLLLHYVFDKTLPTPIKSFPANTQHCLVFYLQGSVTAFDPKNGQSKQYPKIAINGSQVSRFDFKLSSNYLMFSINFQPGALTKFLRMPLTEFVDERIDAEAILNPEINQVYEAMVNADSYDAIAQIAEGFIWKRIQKLKILLHPIDNVVKFISANPSAFNVEKMAGLACLSISQFERMFVQKMGITPKFFARINRFYRAYQIKDKSPEADWLGIALEAGYYDYQHLVKDFKQFSGTSPHLLLVAQANSPERYLGIG